MPTPGKLCRTGVLCLLAGASALAQQYTISTVAGGAPPATPVAATGAAIGRPNRVAAGAAGSFYFSSSNAVFKVSGGTLSLVAGNSRAGYSGDGGPAVSAQLNNPQGIAVDAAGRIYIADYGNNRIRLVSPDGTITTFAGNGAAPIGSGALYSYGDGGAATGAQLNLPSGVALDTAGNVYIADTADNVIREVTTNGIISTVAGNSYPGYQAPPASGTVQAKEAELQRPGDVAVDSSGNIYIADSGNALIRKVAADGTISNIVGSGGIGYAGDGAVATSATMTQPTALVLDSAGNIYIADNGNSAIRKFDVKSGDISTIAGTGTAGSAGDGSSAAKAQLNYPAGVALDGSGNLYIADTQNLRVRTVASNGNISTVAGNGLYSYSGDGGRALAAQLYSPEAVAVDSAGNLYVADTGNNVVRKVAADGAIAAFAGNGSAGSSSGQLNAPQGLAVDSAGDVYIADTQNARVLQVSPAGSIATVAGNGSPGYGGDGGSATAAQLNLPLALAVDSSGNLYIADFGNNRVRKVTAGGVITTVAGNARLNSPQGVAVDPAGNLYIADTGNARVLRVAADGAIATVAGNGTLGYSGDGGPATSAQLASPTAVAVDAAGDLFIVDSGRIRKVLAGGTILTIGGTGGGGYSGDGGNATAATMNAPSGIALNAAGDLYVADTGNNAVRMLHSAGYGIGIKAVANGASNLAGPVSPGEVVVLYGSGMGPGGLVQFALGADGNVGANLAGTRVLFGGMAAPVVYTSSTQVGAIVPYGVSGTNVPVLLLYQGQISAPLTVPVAATAPALFTLDSTGKGQALAVNVTGGAINGSANPAKAGDYITLYATGEGQTNPPGTDGKPAAKPLPLPNASVTAAIGGQTATVSYAGGAPGIVAGVMQVNLKVPSGLPAGPAPVVLQVGGIATQSGVTVAVSGN